jgi:hypothetical protein
MPKVSRRWKNKSCCAAISQSRLAVTGRTKLLVQLAAIDGDILRIELAQAGSCGKRKGKAASKAGDH